MERTDGSDGRGLRARIGAWARASRAADPAAHRMKLALGGIAFVLVLHLVFGDKPSEGVPERVDEGKPIRAIDYWRTYGWYVAAANIVILAALLRWLPRWFTRDEAPVTRELAAPERPGRTWIAAVVAAMLVFAALGLPRLSYSMWEDEAYSVQRTIYGEYVREDDGGVEFDEVRWRDTFWYYHIPNNHVLHSILARIAVGAGGLIGLGDDGMVDERVVRIPAFLSGLAAIASIAFLLFRLGEPLAGVFAAWLLALHPWMLRFGTEARGYSLMLALAPLALVCLLAALHRGTWRRWAAYGAVQFLLLWTVPSLVEQVLVTNLVAAVAIFGLHKRTPALRSQATRWLAVNALGAMAFVQLMIPNIMQLPDYLERTRGRHDLGIRFVEETASDLSVGMPWSYRARGVDPHYPELVDTWAASPVLTPLVLGAAGAALALGVVVLLRAGRVRRLLPWVFLLPAPLTYAVSVWNEQNLFPWYLNFELPSAVALVALGFAWPARRGGVARAVAIGAFVAFLAAYAVITAHPRATLRAGPVKPARDSVLLTRPNLDPSAPENARIRTVHFCDMPIYYDPLQWQALSVDALETQVERAKARGQTLFLNLGRIARIEGRCPELLEYIEGEARERFELVETLHGFEPRWTRRVYRYVEAPETAALRAR